MNYDLKEVCKDIRCDTVACIGHLGVGHIGGCLSVVEALAVLYFKEMNIDPKRPQMAGRDRFICSKGHAGPAVYATLANRGYFDKKELLTLNQGGTNLPSHCDMNRTVGIDMTTGSLGQGFSCAVGVALGSKLEKDGATIYTLIGDGESQEGQIWEAAMFAAAKKLDNLIAFTDYNNCAACREVGGLRLERDRGRGRQRCRAGGKGRRACQARPRQRQAHHDHPQHPQGLRCAVDRGSGRRQPQLQYQ